MGPSAASALETAGSLNQQKYVMRLPQPVRAGRYANDRETAASFSSLDTVGTILHNYRMLVNMTSKLQAIFGKRVRRRRKVLGMTQTDLAEKVGIQRPDLSDIEHGRHAPTLKTVEKMAEALDVTPPYLVRDH